MDLTEYISKETLEQTLLSLWKDSPATGTYQKEHTLGTQLKILARKQIIDTKAEIHDQEGDLWFCLEGSATFVLGGTLKNPTTFVATTNTTLASGIEGGKTILLHKGDWLYIPPKQAHQHTEPIEATLLIIKIPSKG